MFLCLLYIIIAFTKRRCQLRYPQGKKPKLIIGREQLAPCLFHPSNRPMYLYAVVRLISQSLANSVRLNAPFLYCG